MTNVIGSWAFLIGVILAIVVAAVSDITTIMAIILVILGLVVGLLNVTGKEIQPFLMAGTVLVIVSALGQNVLGIIPIIGRMLSAILILFVPATMIVALKSVFSFARK
jgi:uncharacterized membrane protein|tara:strand:+ start:320 stop:643 length:324 start_codon:yes stop_codon:yes gene_type:complete